MTKIGKCVTCGQKFQPKKKGYKRFSLKSQLGPSFDIDVAAALSRALPEVGRFPSEGHVCDSCFRLLRSTLRQREQLLKTEIEWENRLRTGPQGKLMSKSKSRGKMKKSKQSASADKTKSKRKLGEVQNIMTDGCSERARKRLKLAPTVAVLCKNGGHQNYMKKAIAYLLQYRYHKAMSLLITGSERAKRAFLGVLENEVRKEVFYFCRSADKFSAMESAMKSFSWKKELKGMESKMPTFYSACYAAMDTRKGVDLVQSSASSRKRLIRPRLGLMMTLPLYTRRERKFGFVMHILSLLIHRYGSHDKMIKILHHLGICQRTSVALSQKVDAMHRTDSETLLSWAACNLAEMKSSKRSRAASKRTCTKGKVPKAELPPADTSLSDDSLDSDKDNDSDDENMLADSNDDEEEEEEDEEDDDDDDDDEDDDDASLLNMLSSDESTIEEDQEEEEEGWDDAEEKVEECVEVDGCVQDIEGQEVEYHVLMDVYKALKERV